MATLYEEDTRFLVKNIGNTARTSWATGDILKCYLQSYSGFDGVPILSFEKTNSGDLLIKICNTVKTGSPVVARNLNGFCQMSIELIKFNVYGIP